MRDVLTFRIATKLAATAVVFTFAAIFIGMEVFRLIPSVIMAAVFLFVAGAARRYRDSDTITRVAVWFISAASYLMSVMMMLPVVAFIVDLMSGAFSTAESFFEGLLMMGFILLPIFVSQRLFSEGWAGRQWDRARIVLAAMKVVAVRDDVDFDELQYYESVPLSEAQRQLVRRRMIMCMAIVCAMSLGTGYIFGELAGDPVAAGIGLGFVISTSIWILGFILAVWLGAHAGMMYRLVWTYDGLRNLERSEANLLKRSEY